MEILGLALAVLMGFTLGLLGGGGSILTVPILVYVLAIEPVLATGYSLFVVGTTAIAGAFRKNIENLVDWNTALVFAVPSLLAVFATRYYLVPAIPDQVLGINGFMLTKDIAIMLFFALVMLLSAYSMIRNFKIFKDREARPFNTALVMLEGVVVGVITGMVGAGGGFLIVPALVLLVNLPIKKAVGTSLVIIAAKSLIGFLGDIGTGRDIDWGFLLLFTGFAVAGMFGGIYATRYISPLNLKKGFGWFTLAMGIFIIIKEFYDAA